MKAMDLAHAAIDKMVALQRELVEKFGKPKEEVSLVMPDAEFVAEISGKIDAEVMNAIRNPENAGKESAAYQLRDDLKARLLEDYPEREAEIEEVLEKIFKKNVRKMIAQEGARPDGRGLDEIRPLSCEVGLLPRVHGSGLFSRGQTQVLTNLVLGSLDDAQIIDTLEEDSEKRFMHFYNFPPFSVGEVRPLRAPAGVRSGTARWPRRPCGR